MELCDQFFADKVNDPNWKCYQHSIALSNCAELLREGITALLASLRADLELIKNSSQIMCEANTNAVNRTTNSNSVFSYQEMKMRMMSSLTYYSLNAFSEVCRLRGT